MSTGFAPKEVIEGGHHRLEVLSGDTADTYGPQLAFKMKIIGGDHDGHTFMDYAARDEDSGEVKQGSKAWSIFEACLGSGFHRSVSSLEDALGKLEGRQFIGQVTQTRTGSRNKLEFGTIGPVQSGEGAEHSLRSAQQQASQAANTADDPEWESIPF